MPPNAVVHGWRATCACKAVRAASGTEQVLPIVLNNNNFAKGAPGEPTLLSFDDARTLFHEFGHGLHGLLSRVNYERLSGTQVLRDFVELPGRFSSTGSPSRKCWKSTRGTTRPAKPFPMN